tara:strand:- start:668 stop:3973 length:3306 start_codon:yes stop_codon:yes gene_type:complete
MPKYKINITPELSEIVEADSIEDAKKIVKAQIAKGAISPIYDQLYFDYETGVKDLKLRRKLSRAEITKPEEQDALLRNFVGSDGFTRTTNGQLALTPQGLRELGEEVQTRTLSDGTTLELNTIIDENDWFARGDLADFMGVTGPIVGAVASLLPQGRAFKAFKSLAGGNQKAGQVLAGAGGSAIGKGVEEVADAAEGFQLQDTYELTRLLGKEAGLGAAGEGVSLAGGALWRTIFGAKEPVDSLRLLFNSGKGRSLNDLKKLDVSLGREATETEIKKAIADGKINVFDNNFAAAFASMGRTIPGRAQQIAESVLGVKRDKGNIAYLTDEFNKMTKDFRDEDAVLNKYIDQITKEGIDADISAFGRELEIASDASVKQTTQTVKELADAYIGVGSYRDAPTVRGYGENILKLLGDAKEQVDRNVRKKYNAAESAFAQLETDPVIRNAIQETVDTYADAALARIADFRARFALEDAGFIKKKKVKGLQAKTDDINTQNLDLIENRLKNLKSPFLPNVEGVAAVGQEFRPLSRLTQVRNINSDLNRFIIETSKSQPEREVFLEIQRFMDDYSYNLKRGIKTYERPEKAKSILTSLGTKGTNFTRYIESKVFKKTGKKLTNRKKGQINDALKLLRDANRTAGELNQPFDNATINKIVNSARVTGTYDPDTVFSNLVINGSTRQIDDFFNALKQHDEYLSAANKPNEANKFETAQLATLRRLFASAINDSIDPVTDTINYPAFAKYFKKFENDHPGKIDALFRDKTGVGSGKRVLESINQLVKISPRFKPSQLEDLLAAFQRQGDVGVRTSQQGLRFVKALEDEAKASARQLDFVANRSISDLPNKTPDEVVDIIFRPKNQNNINELKKRISAEDFKKVQEASLGKLLENSIDLAYTGKTPITDIFKSGNLRTALDNYGNETLDAMFGRRFTQDINSFADTIDILTKGEVGRGNFPGSLVAAGIAAGIAFAPLATLPTVIGLTVLKGVLGMPGVVRLFTKTDKGSIRQLIDITADLTEQATVRLIDKGVQDTRQAAGRFVEDIQQSPEFQELQDTTQEVIRPPEQPSIELPEIAPAPVVPTSPSTLTPEEQARRQFAEDLFRRPVI